MKDNIKALRQEAHMSQAQLANETGYKTQSIVSMWETGDRTPPSSKLPALAQALGCNIDDLFAQEQGKEG